MWRARCWRMRSADGIAGFAAMLRAHGLRISIGQVLDVHRAIDHIDALDREQFYLAARCLLLTRTADEPLFSALFARYWLGLEGGRGAGAPSRTASSPQRSGQPGRSEQEGAAIASTRLVLDSEEADDSGGDDDLTGRDQIATYSAQELLRRKDFADLTAAELLEVRRLIAELRWETALRRLRRTRRANKGPHIDPRRALRENLAHGGELLTLPRRVRRRKPIPVVLLCDISGSMARYTSLLLRFLHAIRQGRGGVETFVFGTRLTRITRQLRVRDTDQALLEVSGEVMDWGGGTRIGDSIAHFNRQWGRRVLGHGAIVVIISDGWDRGDPALLVPEMARLQRLSHRLVWLNPLLGVAGYQPLTRGMRAALPFVDDFLAAHNLASLEALARLLQDLDERRPGRMRRAAVG